MTPALDFAGFTDEFGERRRRAEMMTSPLLRTLGLVAHGDAVGGVDTSPATVHATSDLLADTLADLGRVEEKLRAQNEALFAARTELERAWRRGPCASFRSTAIRSSVASARACFDPRTARQTPPAPRCTGS